MLETILDRRNLEKALCRVMANGGSAGVDGMQTDELRDYLNNSYQKLRQSVLSGSYEPLPVKSVLIPKPNGATDDEIQGYRKGHIVVGTAKGIGNVILYTVATITQIPGAMHYGNKIPKDKWAENFPAIPTNNVVKDFIVPILTTPVELAEQIKKDPLNFELWGQAIGLFVMYKGLIPTPKYASNFREGNKILKIYNNKDVTLFLAESPDDIGFMKAMGQKASVRILENGNFDITFIGTEFNRISAIEEAIHYQQYKKYGEAYVSEHLAELEVEAQNMLLRIGKKEGWSKGDMAEIEGAKKTWEKLAQKK